MSEGFNLEIINFTYTPDVNKALLLNIINASLGKSLFTNNLVMYPERKGNPDIDNPAIINAKILINSSISWLFISKLFKLLE